MNQGVTHPHPEIGGTTPHPVIPRVTIAQQLLYSCYWFASNFVYGALLGIVNAHEVEILAPSRKAAILGLLVVLGAIPALIVPLIVGVLSDRCTHPWGRRRPYILFGAVTSFVGLALMGLAAQMHSINGYFGAYFALQFGMNTSIAAYSGVIPDMVPPDQRGTASGFMAFMSQVSTLLGVLVAGIFLTSSHTLTYVILLAVFALFVGLTLYGLREKQHVRPEQDEFSWAAYFKSLVEPFKSSDFTWVWITRALMMLGFYSIQPFVKYYLSDVIHVQEPEKKAGYIIALILVGATISGIFGGWISDRTGRKPVVYAASIIISVMALAFIPLANLEQVLLVGLVFGMGYGAYISVDWALGTDVLPNPEDSGKDMAVWHVSMTLPQQIGAGVGGLLLSTSVLHQATTDTPAAYSRTGYGMLFVFAAICFALGAVLLRNVKGAK